MARQYTQQELKAFNDAEQQLRAKGLIVDEADKEDFDVNIKLIQAYFDQNLHAPITVQSILAACDQMKDQLRWKSAAQVKYETEYNKLTQAQKDQFGAWWYSQKKTLVLEGDQGFENAEKLLSWMKGKPFTNHNFVLAVGNLANSVGLHFQRESTFRASRHSGSDSSFMPKNQVNLSERDHKRLRDQAAAAAAGNTKPAPATNYKALCEGIRGKTHSMTDQISKLFVFENGQINWEQTYLSRRRMGGL
jgi:hypothetical protein